MGKFNANMIPEVLNNYNVYDGDGDRLVGITEDMSLSEINSITQAINGAGMGGSYNAAVIGQYESISQTIPFRTLYKNVTKFMDPSGVVRVNVRGAIQLNDTETGKNDFAGFRYVVSGHPTGINPGTATPGGAMNASVTIEATYVLIEIDGEKILEINKLTGKTVINGVDITEKITKLC